MRKKAFLVLAGLLAVLIAIACAGPKSTIRPVVSSPAVAEAEEQKVELTVYNQNFALVKDRRDIELEKGLNQVRFSDVAALIDPTSVHFRSLTDPEGTVVLEQNYEYDLVGTQKLLQKYVDHQIRLVTDDGTAYEGKLLSGTEDVILQAEDGTISVIKLESIKEISFPELPEGLVTRPTLAWLVEAAKEGTHKVEVSYLTDGVNWHADYVLLLAQDDKSVDLNGWVTLDNRSGATYEDAGLKLVAGEVHRVPKAQPQVVRKEMEVTAAAPPQVEERPFFEYHVYEVKRPVTVKDNQTKQIEFVAASGVAAEKFYVYDGLRGFRVTYYSPIVTPEYGPPTSKDVMVMLEIQNSEEAGLGVPLPAGKVRVYKEDADGGVEFVGEDSIDHTPKDERVRLYLGNAFDLVGERIRTDFKRIGDKAIEESFEITVRNHKAEDVEVRVVEHLYRWSEWKIVEASHDYRELDASTIEFRVKVPADGETKVTYTVRYTW